MNPLRLVDAYESAGSLSFSESYLRDMADGSLPVSKVTVVMDDVAYDALQKSYQRTCNVAWYKQLLEDGDDLAAYKYLEANDRSISMVSYGVEFEMGDDIQPQFELGDDEQ